jgi:prefoldin subunit 5
MQTTGQQYQSNNNKLSELATSLNQIATTANELGTTAQTAGKSLDAVGKALIAAGTAGTIFSFGASASLIPTGQKACTVGGQLNKVGTGIVAVAKPAMGVSQAAMALTSPAGADFSTFVGAAESAMSNGSSLLGQIGASNTKLEGISQSINEFSKKAQEFNKVKDAVVKMAGGEDKKAGEGQNGDAIESMMAAINGNGGDNSNMSTATPTFVSNGNNTASALGNIIGAVAGNNNGNNNNAGNIISSVLKLFS